MELGSKLPNDLKLIKTANNCVAYMKSCKKWNEPCWVLIRSFKEMVLIVYRSSRTWYSWSRIRFNQHSIVMCFHWLFYCSLLLSLHFSHCKPCWFQNENMCWRATAATAECGIWYYFKTCWEWWYSQKVTDLWRVKQGLHGLDSNTIGALDNLHSPTSIIWQNWNLTILCRSVLYHPLGTYVKNCAIKEVEWPLWDLEGRSGWKMMISAGLIVIVVKEYWFVLHKMVEHLAEVLEKLAKRKNFRVLSAFCKVLQVHPHTTEVNLLSQASNVSYKVLMLQEVFLV